MINLGKLDNARILGISWASTFQLFMVSYLFIDKTGWHWWFLLIVPLGIVFFKYYLKYVYPKNVDYVQNRSETMRKLFKEVSEIHEIVKKLTN